MKKWLTGILTAVMLMTLVTPVSAALPSGAGVIKSSSAVSGSEFTSKSSIAKKLNKMFAGEIGLYKDYKKTKPVNAALGTRSVPNNNVMLYWGPDPGGGGTSCFAYANAFYGHFYDGVYPHRTLNSNHKKVKATGKISYANLVKWGVRSDAAVYIREGNHSIVMLYYDENYIIYIDGNGDGKGGVALRKEAWGRPSGSNIYNSRPSLIVQPTTSYFAAGSMGKKLAKPCTQGGTSHDWNEGKITKPASCKETGTKTFTCLDCGKTKEETVKKTTDHTFGQWTVTREATCDKEGVKTAVCSVCGKEQTKSMKKLGHDYDKSTLVQEATIYSAGIMEKTCKQCGKVKQTKTACAYEDKALGITLTTGEKVFPKKTKILISTPGEYDRDYAKILQSGKVQLYVLEAKKGDETVAPNGKVTLELKRPEGFGSNLALYRITDTAINTLSPEITDDTLTVELESFGMLALCDLDIPYVPETQPPTEPETLPETQPVTEPATQPETQPAVVEIAPAEPKRFLDTRTERYVFMIGVLAAIFVAGVIALIVILVKRKGKKKTKKPETQEVTTQ